MSKIVKNTTLSDIVLSDVGCSIPASGQVTIAPQDYLLWNDGTDVNSYIASGDIVINDGTSDLNATLGNELIHCSVIAQIVAFDNATNGFTADKVQAAIEEVDDKAIPSGGTTNQILEKVSATDYDTQWTTPSAGAITHHEILYNTYPYWSTTSNSYVVMCGTFKYTPAAGTWLVMVRDNGYAERGQDDWWYHLEITDPGVHSNIGGTSVSRGIDGGAATNEYSFTNGFNKILTVDGIDEYQVVVSNVLGPTTKYFRIDEATFIWIKLS